MAEKSESQNSRVVASHLYHRHRDTARQVLLEIGMTSENSDALDLVISSDPLHVSVGRCMCA